MPPAVVITAASCVGDDAIERAALMAAEGRGAGHLDQIGNAGAVILLDGAVEFDERPAEMLRQHAAERRFAGAAQTDQRDAPRPVGAARHARRAPRSLWRAPAIRLPAPAPADREWRRAPPVRGPVSGNKAEAGRSSALRDGAQHARRRIAGAAFDLRQIALGGLRSLAPIAAASCRAWRDAAAPRARWRQGSRRRTARRRARPAVSFGALGTWHRPPVRAASCIIMHVDYRRHAQR